MSFNTQPGSPRPGFLRSAVVVIPALNEEACVEQAAREWLQWGVALVRVVDNGSSDATASRAAEAGAHVLFEPRRGYGAAAWKGTQGLPPGIKWIVFGSADGSDRPDDSEMAAFQTALDCGADFVLGERVSLLGSRRNLSPVQRVGNALCCQLVALGWGRRFRDMASLRLIRRAAFERLALRDRGFGWNIEMQVRAVEEGLRIVEVPVHHHPRAGGRPKISGNALGVLRAGRGILTTVARLYASRRKRRWSGALPAAPGRQTASRGD